MRDAIGSRADGKAVKVWFQDEARVGQQSTFAYVWAERGARPTRHRDCRRTSAYLFSAVGPQRATGAALVTLHANTEAMNKHLKKISPTFAEGSHAILVLDGTRVAEPGTPSWPTPAA